MLVGECGLPLASVLFVIYIVGAPTPGRIVGFLLTAWGIGIIGDLLEKRGW